MSTKIMSSVTEENRDLRKQIGCMTGIFHHFITGRRISSHNNKRLLLAAKDQPEPRHATKTSTDKDLELQKEKPRTSVESSRPSYSSSCSSHESHKIARQEKLPSKQVQTPESPFQMNMIKEEKRSLTESTLSGGFRHVVKDSMYRETRGVSIKSPANGERRGQAMKRVDSPRPVKQKVTGYDGSTRVLVKDERLALHRFSYDGRESRETFNSAMKAKELPRLSLDSKVKCSAQGNFVRRDLRLENESSRQSLSTNQEPESRPRSSIVVAKLMGLDPFPDANPGDERTPKTNSFIATEKTKQNHENDQPSPSPRLLNANSVKEQSQLAIRSRFPMEPAPWRKHDSSQESLKVSQEGRKAPKDVRPLSSSVYGEIEKRITQLEFRKSGKDLRALKQILDAMQKTRERMEDQTDESTEFPVQTNSHQVSTFRKPPPPAKLGSSIVVMKPVEKLKVSSNTKVSAGEVPLLQNLRIRDHRKDFVHRQEVKDITSRINSLKDLKKTVSSNSELDRTLGTSQRLKVEDCSISGRNLGMGSPRLQKSFIRAEDKSHHTIRKTDVDSTRKQPSRKVEQKSSHIRKQKLRARDSQLNDDQMSELSSETRYTSYQGDTASIRSDSNNSTTSQIETEAHSTGRNCRKQSLEAATREDMAPVELGAVLTEQPSPVSVLNAAFYSDDSPSPVKKKSIAFQDDDQNPDEVDWHLENPRHSPSKRSDHGSEENQKLENMKRLLCELRLSNTVPGETAATRGDGSLKTDHNYINMILQTSGLLKDVSCVSTADQLFSYNLINPEMLHVLEQIESLTGRANSGLEEKYDQKSYNHKTQRRIVFDVVNEILGRKITSGRLFTMARKQISPRVLLKEIHLEIDHLQKMPDCNQHDEDDGVMNLLSADMMFQSEDWADYSDQVPALVLDIERLIFKDLINEVITGELMGLDNSHCRKLFTK